ncbi:MAG: hypothetical protein MZV70_43630 [Desulfobacterales bacterium]|nr:hypothetical protein [Desulfobacterales bacterium]
MSETNVIYIGQKPMMNYVLAAGEEIGKGRFQRAHPGPREIHQQSGGRGADNLGPREGRGHDGRDTHKHRGAPWRGRQPFERVVHQDIFEQTLGHLVDEQVHFALRQVLRFVR